MYNFILPDKLGSDSRTYQVKGLYSIPTIDKTVQLNFEPQVGYSNLHTCLHYVVACGNQSVSAEIYEYAY